MNHESETPNKCAPANRRYASPLGAGRQFGRDFHAQPCSPTAVAELGRWDAILQRFEELHGDNMGFFGRLFAKKLTTFSFEFDLSFEQNSKVSIIEDLPLPEEYQAWVWSLYYAKTLYTLGDGQISNGLKEHIEGWAEPVVAGLGFPVQAAEEMGLLVLDKAMELMVSTRLSKPNAEAYVLKVFKPPNHLPHIQTYQPLKGYQNRFAYSVIVLGQYFINKGRNCAREMAFKALSMRKYYKEIKPLVELNSTIEAPVFALKEYISFFAELNTKLDQFEKKIGEDR